MITLLLATLLASDVTVTVPPSNLPVTVTVTVTVSSSSSSSSSGGGATKWVTGYYVGYQNTMYPPAAVDFANMTHLVLGAALPLADGTLDLGFYQGAAGGPVLAKDLTSRAHAAGRKALMMIGGSGALAGFQGAASAANRAKFVQSIMTACSSLGFDGVDLDWEPVAVADRPVFLALVQAVRAAGPSLIITVPVTWVGSSTAVDPWYAQLATSVDQVNVMSYQMAGAWGGWQSWHSAALAGESATTPSSVSSSANAYAAAGIPKAKIGIGIGLYGSCWKGVTGPRQALPTGAGIVANDNVMTYANVLANYFSAPAYAWDAAASAGSLSWPTAHGPQGCTWLSYEDPASIAAKGAWVKANGFGGAIVWTVNQGAVGTGNPQMEAVRKALLQ